MSDSETMGRCFSEVYERRGSPCELKIADAIDRLAADVAAVKDMAQEIALRVPSEFGRDACDAAVRVQTDRVKRLNARVKRLNAEIEKIHYTLMNRTWERDKLRAEVERLNAELAARQAANYPEYLDSSPAAPQPAAPPAGWLTADERETLQSRLHWLRVCLWTLFKPYRKSIAREVEIINGLLARAGSPPVVEVPAMQSWEYTAHEEALAYRAAMDRAGVAWKEVGRE